MNNYEFYEVALNNGSLFFYILAGSLILHYLIFRSQIKSILDPYFLSVVSSVFCLTDVFLLYFTGNVTNYVFSNYIFTQIAFFLGLFAVKIRKINLKINKNIQPPRANVNNPQSKLIAFYFFSFVYLFSQALVYYLKGIPLFMESRLETFAGGGGAGVLGRITDVCSIFSIYLFFCVIRIDKLRFSETPKYLTLGLIFITFLLSGSKGNFLVVFNIFWCYILFAWIKKMDYMSYLRLLRRNLKLIALASIIVVTLIIFIQSNSAVNEATATGLNPLMALCLRLVHSGDVYWYAYPNNVYLKIPSTQWFAALFNDTLGLLRIYRWNELPEAIGITLKNIHHPSDIPQGPNARHNVFGLIYYGYFGSLIFSFLIGVCLGFIRNLLPYLLNGNVLGGFIFTYIMCKGAALDSDPMLTITYFNNLIFIFPIIYVLYLIVMEFFKIKPIVKWSIEKK